MAIFAKKLGSLIGTLSALTVLPIAFAKPASATLVYGSNIVTNGSFENTPTPLSNGTYGDFSSIQGWNLLSGSSSNVIEVQDNVAGSPFDGNNFVELDRTAVTGIYQTLATTIGQTYQISFAFSPRGGTDAAHNILNVNWGNQSVASLTANGAGLSLKQTAWNTFTYNVVATSTSTILSFNDFGAVSDSYGTYLDAVSVTTVTSVPESGSIMGLLAFGAIGATSLRKRKHQKVTIQA